MFDLIDESGQDLKRYGYSVKRLGRFGVTEAYLKIKSDSEAQKIGLAKGEYYIFNSPFIYGLRDENFDFLKQKLCECYESILKGQRLKKTSSVLIVGLGNPDIASDRLGKEVFDRIAIDAFSQDNHIFKFCPNIFFSTGIDSLEMVGMFVEKLKVDYVVIIDSLTTNNIERLGTSFQFTTSGMTPGSGVNRFGRRICKESIGKPCLSIGVPFMIRSSAFTKSQFDLVLAPKDINENIAYAGQLIAEVINEVLK